MNDFKLIWNSHLVVMLRRIGILYLMLAVCRAVFWFYNRDIIGPVTAGEIFPLLRGALLFDSISIVYANAVFIFCSLLPTRFRERRLYRKFLFWYFIVVNSTVVAINLADAVYFHYTQIRLTAADVVFGGNDNSLRLILVFMGENWGLLVLFAGLVASMVFLYRKSGYATAPVSGGTGYFTTAWIIFFAVIVGSVAIVRGGGLRRTIRPVTMSNAMSYTLSPAKAGMILSNPFCLIRTAGGKSINFQKYYDQQTLEEIFTPYHYPHPADTTFGSQKGKNIVVFVLESFSAELSAHLSPELYPGSAGYTPFLDSLMKSGLTMTDAYSNGRKSIEALPSILGSMPSFKKPFALMPQSLGGGMQLPKIMAREGYETMFFCGSPPGSMGFEAYASLAGFRQSYSKADYDRSRPGNRDADGYWGVWDEPFFDYMGEVLDQTPEPFMSAIFTLSSHHPFKIPGKHTGNFPAGELLIHAPAAYTDYSVRRFFETYGTSEWFRNSLFVFVADHVSSERMAPDSETAPGRHRIVTFFYTPDGSLRGSYANVFQQADIMPTVLGLTGETRAYFAFGRDVYNEPCRIPVVFNYMNNFIAWDEEIVVIYDEQVVIAAYERSDTLQQANIAGRPDPRQDRISDQLKAVIQQYYSHIQRMDYTVPHDSAETDLPQELTDQTVDLISSQNPEAISTQD